MIHSIHLVLWVTLIVGHHFVTGDGCIPPKELMFNFFDASGKFPTAILSGNMIDMGAFDQCLALDRTIENIRYRGKYCFVKIALPELNTDKVDPSTTTDSEKLMTDNRAMIVPMDGRGPGLLVAWCIPDSCPIENITRSVMTVVDLVTGYLPSPFTNVSIFPFMDHLCQTQEGNEKAASTFTSADIGAIAFLAIILAIMVCSTIYDIALHYMNKKPIHILLIAFSIRTNGEKLMAISSNPNQLPCLHGIRFISMMWIIYSHRVLTAASEPTTNLVDMGPWMERPINMYVLGATVSVDTFLFLSGLLVAYAFLQAKSKGVKFNVIMYWVHRYIRLTPALGVMILLQATILNRVGSGPFWPTLDSLKTMCEEKWWHNLLYIHNYYQSETVCLGQTWYLAVDTQLFFLSPLILIPLWRWPKYTLYASLALVFGSIVSSFVVGYYFDLPAGMAITGENAHYLVDYYYTTHTRFGPWLMGVMLGYYIFKLKKNKDTDYTLHPSQIAAGWLLSLTLLLTILFASHDLLYEYDRVANAFFTGLHRHVWTLGLCWVVYACTEGYGGPINAFLSWTPFQVLGRLTYSMYLIHMSVQYLVAGASRTGLYFTDFNVAYKFWGDFFMTLAFSIIFTLAFESPMLVIEKVIFGTGATTKKPKLPTHQPHDNGSKLS